MKHSKLAAILPVLVKARKNVLVKGRPGVGKTQGIIAILDAMGVDYILSHPVVKDPTDYKGIPWAGLNKAGEPEARWLPTGDLRAMTDPKRKKPLVVIFDDAGQAVQATQASLMQIVQERQVDGQHISPFVSFILITNERTDNAGVQGLISPLLDRMIAAITLEFDNTEWVTWALANNMPLVLIAYARFKPEAVGKFVATKDMIKQPTARSVAGLGDLLNLGLDDYELLTNAVGDEFASGFLGFYRVWQDLPNREEVYLNPTKAPVPTDGAVLYATAAMLAHYATPQNIDSTVTYIERLPQEFRIHMMKDAVVRNPKLKQTHAFIKWSIANAAMML